MATDDSALKSGISLPHATIGRELGRGGMAVVYEGADISFTPPRKVAIKLIAPHMSDDAEFRARFEREASTVAHFRHDNIVHIYGSGEVRGTRYIVMELLEGGTLAQRLRAGGLGTEDVVRIARVLADALAYSHEQGVIHRDFKPGNVLFTSGGKPVLTDFGVAKAVRKDETAMTRHAILVGAPSYMAPEQARAEVVTDRADIYSFGITLFEMLTGRLPSPQDLFPAPGSSDASLGSLSAETPTTLVRLLRRCLQLNPAERPSAAHCRQWLEGREQATPPAPASSLHYWMLAAAVVVAIVMGNAIWRASSFSTEPTANSPPAVEIDAEPTAVAPPAVERRRESPLPTVEPPTAVTQEISVARQTPTRLALPSNQRSITTQPPTARIFVGTSTTPVTNNLIEVSNRPQDLVVVAPGYYGQRLTVSTASAPRINIELQRHTLPPPNLVPQLLELLQRPRLLVSQVDAMLDPTFRAALRLRLLDQRGMYEEQNRLDEELLLLERRGDTRASIARYLANTAVLGNVQETRSSSSTLATTTSVVAALGSTASAMQIRKAADAGDAMASLLYALSLRAEAAGKPRESTEFREYCGRMAEAAEQGWSAAASVYLQTDRCQ